MSTILARLTPPAGSVKTAKRLGRGVGSGMGKTCGKGMKGQKARHGGNFGKLHFQGGQTPIQRRLPKRGFRNIHATPVVEVNVGDLEAVFESGAKVDFAALREKRLVQGLVADYDKARVQVKVLGDGELTKKLTVSAHRFSKVAAEKIKKAGGSIVELPLTPQKAESAKA